MGYVYEKISPEDAEAYGLEAISDQVIVGRLMIENWVVDRERDSYLRKVSEGRPDVDEGITRWTFYWNGTLTWICLKFLSTEVEPNGDWISKLRVEEISPLDWSPAAQKSMLESLFGAFRAHDARGGDSRIRITREFEFAPGVLSV